MIKLLRRIFLLRDHLYELPFPKYVFKHELDKLLNSEETIPSSKKNTGNKRIKYSGKRDHDTFKLYSNSFKFKALDLILNIPVKGYIMEHEGLVKVLIRIDGFGNLLGMIFKLMMFFIISCVLMLSIPAGMATLEEMDDLLIVIVLVVIVDWLLSALLILLIGFLPYIYFKAKVNSLEKDMNDLMEYIERLD